MSTLLKDPLSSFYITSGTSNYGTTTYGTSLSYGTTSIYNWYVSPTETKVTTTLLEAPKKKKRKMTKAENYRYVATHAQEIADSLKKADIENKFGVLINDLHQNLNLIRSSGGDATKTIQTLEILVKRSNDKTHQQFNKLVRNLHKNFTTAGPAE